MGEGEEQCGVQKYPNHGILVFMSWTLFLRNLRENEIGTGGSSDSCKLEKKLDPK